MWALVSLGLIATMIASPARQVLIYQWKSALLRNDMTINLYTSIVEGDLKDSCQKYADNEAFNNFINVRANIIQELESTAITEAAKAVVEGEQPKLLTLFCKLSPKIKTRVTAITAAVKPCLIPKYREKLIYSQTVADSILDYVCYNSGERVESFFENRGDKCITERHIGLRQCTESAMSQEDSQPMNEEDKENNTAEECRELTELEKCIKRELDQCSNQSSSNFLTGLMDSIINPVCEKYTRN